MNHRDHVALLRPAGIGSGQVWADLGAGTGAFTLAIAELLGGSGSVFAVDRDQHSLHYQAQILDKQYPWLSLQYLHQDITQPQSLPPLDGVVMANVLHYLKDQVTVLRHVATYLKFGGKLVTVEYDTDEAGTWLPYPVPFQYWVKVAQAAGLADIRKLATCPTSDPKVEFYSAVGVKQ